MRVDSCNLPVHCMQECLSDDAPAVQAAGMDCVALLCEADLLEFYAAWRVVQAVQPSLPEHPLPAVAWVSMPLVANGASWRVRSPPPCSTLAPPCLQVRLLGSAALDAAVQPEPAAAIVDALWLAAASEEPQVGFSTVFACAAWRWLWARLQPVSSPVQVRCQAYASLASFSLETLEEAGALRPLGSFVELLQAEALHQQASPPAHASQSRRQQHAATQALAACEALVCAALEHEHAVRRRPGPAERAARHGPGSDATAAAHRLQTAVPKKLLGGSATALSEFLQRVHDLPAAAVLYLYAPPPPPAGSQAAVRQAAADYHSVLVEIAKQPLAAEAAAAAVEDACAAAEVLDAWAAFLRRLLAAGRAAQRQSKSEGQHDAAAAMQAWSALGKLLAEGAPAVSANAALAAAALCCSTRAPLPQLVAAVHGALSEASAPGSQCPAILQRAALCALGAMADALRWTVGEPAVRELLQSLEERLQSPARGAATADAACAATAIGIACRALSSPDALQGGDGSSAPSAAGQQLRRGIGSLLAALNALLPASGGSSSAAAAAAGLPTVLPPARPGSQAALPAVAIATATALNAADASFAQLLLPIVQPLRQLLSEAALPPAAPALSALLAAATAAAFRADAVASSDVSSALRMLLSLASTKPFGASAAAARSDGSLPGAAALAAARLTTSAVQHGFAASLPSESPSAVAQQILALVDAAGKLQHSLAAKRQAAAGLAVLLRAGAVEPGAAEGRLALAALERLACSDNDPRTRHACAQPLASLCYVARREGLTSSADGAAGAPSRRGLAQLAPDGALRPLLEALIEGRWTLSRESWPSCSLAVLLFCLCLLLCRHTVTPAASPPYLQPSRGRMPPPT